MTHVSRRGAVWVVWVVVCVALGTGSGPSLAWGQDVTLAIPTLPPGKQIIITFNATVNGPPLGAGVDSVSAQGRIQSTVAGTSVRVLTDAAYGPGSSPQPTVTVIAAAPDLRLTLTDGGVTVTPGSGLVYRVGYTNSGTQHATGVVITETVPAHTTFDPASSDPRWTCTPDGQAGSTCQLPHGALPVGRHLTVNFGVSVATAVPPGVAHLTNTARIDDDSTQGPDLHAADNDDTVRTPLTLGPVPADVTLTTTAPSGPLPLGSGVFYTLTVHNLGPATATSVVLMEHLPAGTTLVAVNPGAPTCTTAGTTVTCDLGDVAAHATAVVSLTLQLHGITQGSLINRATVTAATPDPVPENNRAQAVTVLNSPPHARDDTATTPVRTAVTLTVLANDTDVDGDTLTVVRVTQGSQGRVTWTRRAVTYTPQRTFVGTDTFAYTVSDHAGHVATAAVAVTVQPVASDLLTPHDGDVIAGDAVTVASFALSEISSSAATAAATSEPVSILFQFRPPGATLWQDVDEAVIPPFFLVLWNTTLLADGPYELRAVARYAGGVVEASPPILVTIANVNPMLPPTIVENLRSKVQRVAANADTVVVTVHGVILVLPAGTFPVPEALMVSVLDGPDVPGIPPGELAGMLVGVSRGNGLAVPAGSYTVLVPYADFDDDGLVDGGEIDERQLSLWFFDAPGAQWHRVEHAAVRTDANVVEAVVPQLTALGVWHVTDQPVAPLRISLGTQSPAASTPLTVMTAAEDLAVLQVRVETTSEAVALHAMRLMITPDQGDATLAKRMRVKVVHDRNANGQVEAGEDTLATSMLKDIQEPLRLSLTPSLEVPAMAITHLLVVFDVRADGAFTPVTPLAIVPWGWGAGMGWGIVLSAWLLGRHWRWRRVSTGVVWGLAVCLVGCGLVLTSCQGGTGADHGEGEVESLTVTVTLPANGVRAEGEVSGLLTGPAAALLGATVHLVP